MRLWLASAAVHALGQALMEQFNEPPEKALTMWLISVRVPSALNGTTTLSDRDLSGVRRCVSRKGIRSRCQAYLWCIPSTRDNIIHWLVTRRCPF
ncbi:hypothetical protein EV401DRAFT_1973703, partial [Pisolithus croceorrhizus]